MAVYENSRYLHTALSNRKGWDKQVFQIRERFIFDESLFTSHEWCDGDTLDGVAYKYLGSTALRWAVLDANPKYRTEFEIKPGHMINIPDYDEVVNLVDV